MLDLTAAKVREAIKDPKTAKALYEGPLATDYE